jgi:hypothetical protein
MVHFYRPRESLDQSWREVGRLWRSDSIRRRHQTQLNEVRVATRLEQCDLWLAWDDAPITRPGEWGGPHYAIGIIVTCAMPPTLVVQFAAARDLRRWVDIAVARLENFARRRGCHKLELCCRKGWRQEMTRIKWGLPVTIKRDPLLLRTLPCARA